MRSLAGSPDERYPRFDSSVLSDLCTQNFSKISVLTQTGLSDARSILARWASSVLGTSLGFADISQMSLEGTQYDELRHNKKLRIFDAETAKEFLNLPDLLRIQSAFFGFRLADVTFGPLKRESRPEVYVRMVRPKKAADVGGFHQDHWYNILYTPDLSTVPSYKVWLALEVPKGAGLRFARTPAAPLDFDVSLTANGPRPTAKPTQLVHLEIVQPEVVNGEALLFNQFALHAGAINPGPTNRISIELCFFKQG